MEYQREIKEIIKLSIEILLYAIVSQLNYFKW